MTTKNGNGHRTDDRKVGKLLKRALGPQSSTEGVREVAGKVSVTVKRAVEKSIKRNKEAIRELAKR